MRVRAIRRFYDAEENVMREVGDTFDVTAERLEQINSTRYGQLVEVLLEEGRADEKPKEAPKRRATRRRTQND